MSWSPGWAWLVLAVAVTLFVAAFDVHAMLSGGETMSGRMRDWLASPVISPFIVAGWFGLFAGLMWHFVIRRLG